MDNDYIVKHLQTLAGLMFTGEPFAKYNKRRDCFIFGGIKEDGTFKKNIVTKNIAIYLVVGIPAKQGKPKKL